jgi:hypothetical protein
MIPHVNDYCPPKDTSYPKRLVKVSPSHFYKLL